MWVEPAQPKLGKKVVFEILGQFWAVEKRRVEPAQPEFFGKKTGSNRLKAPWFQKIGRVAPAEHEFLCEFPGEPAHLDWGNMAKGKRGTNKQHNNKPIGNTQKNNTATVGAHIVVPPLALTVSTRKPMYARMPPL